MRGAIHGIWLTKKDGKLPATIIPALDSWATQAKDLDFEVVLWTNVADLNASDIASLQQAQFKIMDPKACKDSPLFKFYNYFFKQGLQGDNAAFALASDVLRMAILDFTADSKYFIYADPNDTEMTNLTNDLQHIDHKMHDNPLGFAFPIGVIPEMGNLLNMRNDVLIALKSNNPGFFKAYLTAYWANLNQTYKKYQKPITNVDAKLMANRISNQVSGSFFRVEANNNSLYFIAQFADYAADYKILSTFRYLTYDRITSNGNTWLPGGLYTSIEDEIIITQKYHEMMIADHKAMVEKQLLANKPIQHTYIYIGLACTVVIATLLFYFRKRVSQFRIAGR